MAIDPSSNDSFSPSDNSHALIDENIGAMPREISMRMPRVLCDLFKEL